MEEQDEDIVKVYVASSWKNQYQPEVVELLLRNGHQVYDFRAPAADVSGFSWEELDRNWMNWDVAEFRKNLALARAQEAFRHDSAGLEWCDACVLVLPSGNSAHLEAGWCAARGKMVTIYSPEKVRPDLMYKLFDRGGRTPIFQSLDEVLVELDKSSS